MSTARAIFSGKTYLITRRCTQRQFLLRPSELNSQIFLYCLAKAVQRTGVIVHNVCVLSNHYHAVVTDPDARIPELTHYLHEYVSKCINASLGRSENLWSTEQPCMIPLDDDEDVMEKLVYVHTNPVVSGLVEHSDQWPGVRTTPEDMIGKSIRCPRPDAYFVGTEEVVYLDIQRPQIFQDLSDRKFVARLKKDIKAKERKLRAKAKAKRISFLGVAAIKAQQPTDTPSTVAPQQNKPPRIEPKRYWKQIEALRQGKEFLEKYREEWLKWRQGIRDVLFPKGTYALVRFACVPTET